MRYSRVFPKLKEVRLLFANYFFFAKNTFFIMDYVRNYFSFAWVVRWSVEVGRLDVGGIGLCSDKFVFAKSFKIV